MPNRYRAIEKERGNGSKSYHTQFDFSHLTGDGRWVDFPVYPGISRFETASEALNALEILRENLIVKETVIS